MEGYLTRLASYIIQICKLLYATVSGVGIGVTHPVCASTKLSGLHPIVVSNCSAHTSNRAALHRSPGAITDTTGIGVVHSTIRSRNARRAAGDVITEICW